MKTICEKTFVGNNMFLRLLVVACILAPIGCQKPTLSSGVSSWTKSTSKQPSVCLTGQMTDVQSWVNDSGAIVATKVSHRAAIDLSSSRDPASVLQQAMARTVRVDDRRGRIRFLGMARCQLTSVPQVFNFRDCRDRPLSETLQYVTFFGNQFHDFGPPGQRYDAMLNATDATNLSSGISISENREKSTWDVGFRNVIFSNLLELDLRSCHIQHLSDRIFEGMPSLKSLYLTENKITYISANAFFKLDNLIHLDLSHNSGSEQDGVTIPLSWESDDIFGHTPNLTSLDFSQTLLSSNGVAAFHSLGRSFRRLSLCYTGINFLKPYSFKNTQLRYLDLSGNSGIIHDPRSLDGLQKSLRVLYADRVSLKSLESLLNFEALEVLRLSNNELSFVDAAIAKTWHGLRILDLGHNRLSSWMEPVYSKMSNLDILSLRNNNINMINLLMLQDVRNVSYLALSGNFFVCTCYNRELFEIAANNEKRNDKNISLFHFGSSDRVISHHTGYSDYFDQIINRNIVGRNCDEKDTFCRHEANADINGIFRLFDYDPDVYECYMIDEVFTLEFAQVDLCRVSERDIYEDYIWGGWVRVVIIVVVAAVCVLLLILGIVFRRSFKYFYITVKNSALLSMMDESKDYKDGSIFNYDVFVSYCNEDRQWVLDQLLPHVEKDCNISVCLHERDFQVGLSILENIVSCMDRSRSIMLIISQRFLLSQWCQFEMHLAQHRLLETRREDLILILLEDIPRRLRPNTLHYLMLTKTYVLWPKDPTEQVLFWKRLRKSLVTRKLKQTDNESLT